ncbi:PQQ-dependent sugar dehydrogenase [Candidatus Synechococcus calcipolaris G9]|uniref:PQQ-dependent sugar dehydrogenase n=1 Tax=Candidatus Synechococcus calcipolaris G9 TaxID=1497997 RepID=A0ABT6F127_9SYNE|nr:PQQ-dependent sugar dehydrogenase [Candidatus Synechococcus calcipolaris]MDG2991483.1 PQQ-dependent sugar dehydrogenase [Candidatus Synechococcus calcipolaris G9]
MVRWSIALAVLITTCLLGCGVGSSNGQAPDVDSPSNESMSTMSVQPEPGWELVAIAQGLEHPWAMAWLPNGDILITERPGRLRLVQDGELQPEPIAGIPDIPNLLALGQGGLLDIALHPRFDENQWVYVTYAQGTAAANRTTVARARLQEQSLEDWQVIFEVSPAKPGGQHFGSRLLWLPDETLLVSVGDGGNAPLQLAGALIREQAQDRRSHLGKILRINGDGSIPVDNPFVGRGDRDGALWSYGHRNSQGLAYDPLTDRVWSTEHGALGGDELNLIEPGKNYGWPVVTHSRDYSGAIISTETSQPGMVDPLVVWTPAIAPSGLALYRGDRHGGWQGNLFAGGLVSQEVHRIELDDQGQVLRETSIPIGQRVRDVRQGPDDFLYVLTDSRNNGQLLRIEPN